MASRLIFSLACLALGLLPAQGAVSTGGLAVVGYDDDADSITLATLEDIRAGEVVYLTNNGWCNAISAFHGADVSQGTGSESLLKLTFSADIARGTILCSSSNGTGYSWTKSGLVPGQVGGYGEFSDLLLQYESDQIFLFQACSEDLPLMNIDNFIYVMHSGNGYNPTLVDQNDPFSSDLPTGLSYGDYSAFAQTILTYHGDGDGNHSAWSLNLFSPEIAALQSSGGSDALWRDAIANSSNWSSGSLSTSSLLVMAAPEPGRALLLALGALPLALRRRRRA